MPNCPRFTVSGIVFTRSPLRSYTVIVCRYIMFCANTSPRSEATTDFGEMSPETVRVRASDPSDDGMGAVVVEVGVDDVVVELAPEPAAGPSAETALDASPSDPPAPSAASAPRAPTEIRTARRTGRARRGIPRWWHPRSPAGRHPPRDRPVLLAELAPVGGLGERSGM